jgi:hypothetical protein
MWNVLLRVGWSFTELFLIEYRANCSVYGKPEMEKRHGGMCLQVYRFRLHCRQVKRYCRRRNVTELLADLLGNRREVAAAYLVNESNALRSDMEPAGWDQVQIA